MLRQAIPSCEPSVRCSWRDVAILSQLFMDDSLAVAQKERGALRWLPWLMAYTGARRTNEIGIRIALGSRRPRVIWMVLREALAMAIAGLAIGLPAAFAASRLVKAFLFQMKPTDPLALTMAVAILLAAALLAGYGPAWRASKVDPWTALRDE